MFEKEIQIKIKDLVAVTAMFFLGIVLLLTFRNEISIPSLLTGFILGSASMYFYGRWGAPMERVAIVDPAEKQAKAEAEA